MTRSASVALRPLPHPYRAGLALSNDADLMTIEQYRRLRRLLGSSEASEWGPGLGLDVGGSFFMYRSPDSPNVFTVFDGLGAEVTDEGGEILEWAGAGELDVLHSYGCFTSQSHFERSMAEHAIETLERHGVRIRTWVNHGPPSNIQNLGSLHGWEGDDQGKRGYHADLTTAHGVRWVWTGPEMTDEIALDGRPRRRLRRAAPRCLIEPLMLRDGAEVRRFYRFAGLGGGTPVLDDLPKQLSDRRLDDLVRRAGTAVVYQHLAVRRRAAGFGPQAYGPVDDDWFRPAELGALRRLAARFHSGELWVAPTTHILRFRDAVRGMVWRTDVDAAGELIVIDGESISTPDLYGVAFYCRDPAATRAVVERDGERVAIGVSCNEPDATGRPSLTLGSGE